MCVFCWDAKAMRQLPFACYKWALDAGTVVRPSTQWVCDQSCDCVFCFRVVVDIGKQQRKQQPTAGSRHIFGSRQKRKAPAENMDLTGDNLEISMCG